MRQWELIGITDTVDWSPPRREPAPAEGDEAHLPAVLWTTDGSLRLRGISWVASMTWLGYFLGQIVGAKTIERIGYLIIVVSVAPVSFASWLDSNVSPTPVM